jgi:2-polyprenyl-6-hydroxyphenyl methylase/3-demethylubiquinone-9 3-methyltransferase
MIDSEVKKFDNIASEWWYVDGGFKMLHIINPIRISYIHKMLSKYISNTKHISTSGIKILDLGCGGGIVSIPLSKSLTESFVVGVDAGIQNISVASNHAKKVGSSATFIHTEAKEWCDKNQEQYDMVVCFELLEHVSDVSELIKSISSSVKPGGIVIFSTLNRTRIANILAICVAENILRWLPVGTHKFEKFITPSELCKIANQYSLEECDISGMSYNIIQREFYISKDINVNYFATFIKNNVLS